MFYLSLICFIRYASQFEIKMTSVYNSCMATNCAWIYENDQRK